MYAISSEFHHSGHEIRSRWLDWIRTSRYQWELSAELSICDEYSADRYEYGDVCFGSDEKHGTCYCYYHGLRINLVSDKKRVGR